jgi:hypothetical protein
MEMFQPKIFLVRWCGVNPLQDSTNLMSMQRSFCMGGAVAAVIRDSKGEAIAGGARPFINIPDATMAEVWPSNS